jgi:hypothetical protein
MVNAYIKNGYMQKRLLYAILIPKLDVCVRYMGLMYTQLNDLMETLCVVYLFRHTQSRTVNILKIKNVKQC